MKENFKRVFLDTSPIIYLLDNDPVFGDKTSQIFSELSENHTQFVSSMVTLAEYLVYPYRTNNESLIKAFWDLVQDNKMVLHSINQKEAEQAAKIRAVYKNFKPMDSLQLAVAYLHGCDLFLTNDKQLKQFQDVKCVTVAEWEF